jgi:hypothetical protein
MYYRLRTWNGAVVVCFKTAFQYFPKGTKNDRERLQVCIAV